MFVSENKPARSLMLIAGLLGLKLLLANDYLAFAQEFYKDKTIRVIVGQAAGGGYDTYTRTIARHISKHIPGNPSVIVENMTGV